MISFESCLSHTVTDYWVSCASSASISCSTYSNSVASGCSVTAMTSTTASACPLGAYASPDPTMAGFDYSNEYPVLNPGYSSNFQWTYIVVNIVESGVVVGGASVGPSDSANSMWTTGITTPTRAGNSITPGSGASTMPILTTTNLPSSTSGGSSASMTEHLQWRWSIQYVRISPTLTTVWPPSVNVHREPFTPLSRYLWDSPISADTLAFHHRVQRQRLL